MKCESLLINTEFFIIWTASYQILKLILSGDRKSSQYCSRVVSLIHALISITFGLPACFSASTSDKVHEWTPNLNADNDGRCLMSASLAYFIYDLILCIYDPNETKVMVLHHIFSAFTIGYILLNDLTGFQASCNLALLEITNPFLQLRWFLRTEGFYPSQVHTIVEVIFFILFLLVRILWGTYYTYKLWVHSKDNGIIFLFTVLYIISWLFIRSIIQYIVKQKKKQ